MPRRHGHGDVILKEFHLAGRSADSKDHCLRLTDLPLLVVLDEKGGAHIPAASCARPISQALDQTNNPAWQDAGASTGANGSLGAAQRLDRLPLGRAASGISRKGTAPAMGARRR